MKIKLSMVELHKSYEEMDNLASSGEPPPSHNSIKQLSPRGNTEMAALNHTAPTTGSRTHTHRHTEGVTRRCPLERMSSAQLCVCDDKIAIALTSVRASDWKQKWCNTAHEESKSWTEPGNTKCGKEGETGKTNWDNENWTNDETDRPVAKTLLPFPSGGNVFPKHTFIERVKCLSDHQANPKAVAISVS